MALTYPQNLLELIGEGAGGINFAFYERPNSQTSMMGEMVMLYLPNNLRNPMDVNWEQTSMGKAGQTAINKFGNAGQERNTSGLALEALKSGLSNVADMTGLINATAVREYTAQAIANPYIAMTFKSLGFRKFSMEFRFTPHNSAESTIIDDIIKEFRRCALPTNNGATLGYPGEVQITYLGKCFRWLPMFKPSVITALDVNYTGQGFYAGMQDGFPAETILTLEFTENVLVFRDDVHSGASY